MASARFAGLKAGSPSCHSTSNVKALKEYTRRSYKTTNTMAARCVVSAQPTPHSAFAGTEVNC